eukprot:TRINITY_DN2825_c0_g1_i5.p1 TRINITY_DN2825_c0_g1~~TRINITY_DN2825_c0_g1_i5.p1  ORF type:complete len:607 (+),score=137.00 TRINITY_DN2825_c0_g1_i5:67-1887(+)
MPRAAALLLLAAAAPAVRGDDAWVLGKDYMLYDDMEVPMDRHYRGLGNAGVVSTAYLYREGKVNYWVDTDSGLNTNDYRISRAVQHWEARTCIRFRKCATRSECGRQYMVFQDGSGCSSPIGAYGVNRINLGRACGTGAAIHEIGHSLGMTHEQCRNDRDEYVTVNYDNIIPRNKHNFNKRGRYGRSLGPYDYQSIMHYGAWDFTSNRQKTITAPVRIGQRSGLSRGDVAAIQFMYQNCQARPAKPDCMASKSETVTHTLQVGKAFQVEFNSQFIGGRAQVSYPENTTPSRRTRVTRSSGSNIGSAGFTSVTFTPSAADAGQVFTLSATMSGGSGSSTCKVAVRVAGASVPTPSTPTPPSGSCTDSLMPNGGQWFMRAYTSNYDCSYLATRPSSRCETYGGTSWKNTATGMTGQEACCACGGGSTGTFTRPPTTRAPRTPAPRPRTPSPPPPPTPAPGPCSDMTQPGSSAAWHLSNGAQFDCAYFGKDLTRCGKFGGDDYRNFGRTAQEACCVCGGGIRNDTPTPAPTTLVPPTPTPTTSAPPTPTPPTPAPPTATPPTPAPPTATPPTPAPPTATPPTPSPPTATPPTPPPPTPPPPPPPPNKDR